MESVASLKRIVHILATRYPIMMEFESNWSILNVQAVYIEKSKFNIAKMWLIKSPFSCHILATAKLQLENEGSVALAN